MSNKIVLKSISELKGMKFFIPDYQRGYRWSAQQVKDLLNDIDEFIRKKDAGFYCIQPLVVKKNVINENGFCNELKKLKPAEKERLIDKTEKILNDYTRWEVIDGQQRLTTIFILLSHFESFIYDIEYQTRIVSQSFLTNIDSKRKNENIDYFHIVKANQQIKAWFRNKGFDENFLATLLMDVKFIWYESVNEDPIEVFTRLNIGKIALTNSELIKALFLNKSNFKNDEYQKIRLKQQEIAGDWDTIENSLQNDEMWLFINEPGYDKPTRIDFVFDLICKKNILNLNEEVYRAIGTDEYRTFRYFYNWFNGAEEVDITTCWREIKTVFQIIKEWFNDLELYHYVGYLVGRFWKIPNIVSVSKILDEWKEAASKKEFVENYILRNIKGSLYDCSNLDQQYGDGKNKTLCRRLLLLHNLQTVITQNKTLSRNEKYKQPVFYKFPFHLFKKENWDVEHIASSTENVLDSIDEKREWLMNSLLAIADAKLRQDVKTFLENYMDESADAEQHFEGLYERIIKESDDSLTDEEKDKLWNFTLLDASTNRGYGNSIFPVKRRAIIGKDQGKILEVNDAFEIQEKDGAIAFIPPCTRNVFLKYYHPSGANLREWTRADAGEYQRNISTVLNLFLPTNTEHNGI